MRRHLIMMTVIFNLLVTNSLEAHDYDQKKAVLDSLSSRIEEAITIAEDSEEEKQLQAEVDKGHQPWRLEAIDVAYASVTSKVSEAIQYEQCNLKQETLSKAEVECNGTKSYTVHLKRLVRPGSIWIPFRIEIRAKPISEPGK